MRLPVQSMCCATVLDCWLSASAWVYFFRPPRASDPANRRIYLVLFFGISAVVALISLLVIAYRVFEFSLVEHRFGKLARLDTGTFWLADSHRGRGPYHFALWRSDRVRLAAEQSKTAALVHRPAVITLMVVAPQGYEPLLDELHKLPGIGLHWIPAVGPMPEQTKFSGLLQLITARAQSAESGLLIILTPTARRNLPFSP